MMIQEAHVLGELNETIRMSSVVANGLE